MASELWKGPPYPLKRTLLAYAYPKTGPCPQAPRDPFSPWRRLGHCAPRSGAAGRRAPLGGRSTTMKPMYDNTNTFNINNTNNVNNNSNNHSINANFNNHNDYVLYVIFRRLEVLRANSRRPDPASKCMVSDKTTSVKTQGKHCDNFSWILVCFKIVHQNNSSQGLLQKSSHGLRRNYSFKISEHFVGRSLVTVWDERCAIVCVPWHKPISRAISILLRVSKSILFWLILIGIESVG